MCRLNHSTHEKNIEGINDVCVNEKRRSNKLFFFFFWLVTLIPVSQMGLSRQCTCIRDSNSRQGKKAQEKVKMKEAFLQFTNI